jgi:NADH dehydrogenase
MIAITGASGFVGREVVRQAQAAGLAVRAIVREVRRAPPGVELFHGNVLYAPSLEGAFTGCRAVIHLVGIINEWQENTFERAHVQATQNVLDAAKRTGVKRFVHMSALGTRPDAASRFHQTKWMAEEAVRKSGLAWTIFRPSLIYGPADRSVNRLANVTRMAPVVPVFGDGRGKIQPVAVEHVAHCFVAAVRTDAAVQRTYDLCGPAALTWNEFFDKLLAAQGLRRPKVHLPLPLARALGTVLGKMSPYPPFNREQVIMSREDNVGDPGPAERDFCFTQEPFEPYLARRFGRG